MASSHGLDAEYTQTLTVAIDQQAIVGIETSTVLGPIDIHGQIALVHRARD